MKTKYCPWCGSHLVIRVNKKTGKKFFGCSYYPYCNYSLAYKEFIINSECPNCLALLHRCKSKRDGKYFLGCSRWPACSHVQPDRGEIGISAGPDSSNAYLAEVLEKSIEKE